MFLLLENELLFSNAVHWNLAPPPLFNMFPSLCLPCKWVRCSVGVRPQLSPALSHIWRWLSTYRNACGTMLCCTIYQLCGTLCGRMPTPGKVLYWYYKYLLHMYFAYTGATNFRNGPLFWGNSWMLNLSIRWKCGKNGTWDIVYKTTFYKWAPFWDNSIRLNRSIKWKLRKDRHLRCWGHCIQNHIQYLNQVKTEKIQAPGILSHCIQNHIFEIYNNRAGLLRSWFLPGNYIIVLP